MKSNGGSEQTCGHPFHEFNTASDVPGLPKTEQSHLNSGGALPRLQIRKKYCFFSQFDENKITGLSQQNEDMVLMVLW